MRSPADGVTVNNVAPGYTLTERQNELAEARSKALGKIKAGNHRDVGGADTDAAHGERGRNRRGDCVPRFRARFLHHGRDAAS